VPSPSDPVVADAALALEVATRAARLAGEIQLRHLDRIGRIEFKGTRDIVTRVDRLCEEAILDEIRAVFPSDSVLGEESGPRPGAAETPVPGHGPMAPPQIAAPTPEPATWSGRAWIVDPLDGTVNYANGIPAFCVSIALVAGGDPLLGVVYDPVRDELMSAVRGEGVRLGGRPAHNAGKSRLIDCVVSGGQPARGVLPSEAPLRARVRAVRHLGSSALSLAYVGIGRFDAFVHPVGLSNWDIAAAGLVAQEGGATVTTVDGRPWFDLARPPTSIGLLAATPAHHAELLALFR